MTNSTIVDALRVVSPRVLPMLDMHVGTCHQVLSESLNMVRNLINCAKSH